MVACHINIAILLGCQEPLVAFFKLLRLHSLIGKRLHHPDAGKVVLNPAVNLCNLHPVAFKRPLHLLIKMQRIRQHHRHEGKGYYRQLYVNVQKNEKRAQDFNNGNHQILRPVVQKLADVK